MISVVAVQLSMAYMQTGFTKSLDYAITKKNICRWEFHTYSLPGRQADRRVDRDGGNRLVSDSS